MVRANKLVPNEDMAYYGILWRGYIALGVVRDTWWQPMGEPFSRRHNAWIKSVVAEARHEIHVRRSSDEFPVSTGDHLRLNPHGEDATCT